MYVASRSREATYFYMRTDYYDLSMLSRPPAWNHRVAESAAGFLNIILGDEVPVSIDEQFFAIVAVGVVSLVAGDIADVHVVNALRKSGLVEFFQRLDRRRGQST
jgi:hypothetical protein